MERQQLSEDEDAAIQSDATAEIQLAVAFADASPFPADAYIGKDIFVDSERPQS